MPTKVKIGEGITKQTGELLKPHVSSCLLIVTDKGIVNAGILEPIEESLKNAEIKYVIFDKVEPNPVATTANEGVEIVKEYQCDAVLGIGGGSSIDTAKGIAALATNSNQNILDYEGFDKFENPTLPLFAIPTTAGTGSETTASTVFTNNETKFKAVIISPYLYPKLALLDPLLIVNLPSAITAATGMDALTHAIESYTSKNANPVSQALAIQAVKMITENITKAYFVGTDIESRKNMLVASMMAGAAFAQSKLGNVHAISHTFGGVFNIPHGIANATLLPYVLTFNLPSCPEKFKDIAIAMGQDVSGLSDFEAAKKSIEYIQELNQSLGIPDTIKEIGVNLDFISQMVEDSMRSANVLYNPRLTEANDVKKIIENAYYGSYDFSQNSRGKEEKNEPVLN